MVGPHRIAELDQHSVGTGFQLHLHGLRSKGAMLAKVEDLAVDADDQVIVPREAKIHNGIGEHIQRTAGDSHAGVSLARAPSKRPEDVVEVDEAVVCTRFDPACSVAPNSRDPSVSHADSASCTPS